MIREGAIVCPDTIRALFPLPIERNGNEAEKFSDECWEKGLRLDKSPSVHYQLLMETIRWTLIPLAKNGSSVALPYGTDLSTHFGMSRRAAILHVTL